MSDADEEFLQSQQGDADFRLVETFCMNMNGEREKSAADEWIQPPLA